MIEDKLTGIKESLPGFDWRKRGSAYFFCYDFPEVENNDCEELQRLRQLFAANDIEVIESDLEHDCFSGIIKTKPGLRAVKASSILFFPYQLWAEDTLVGVFETQVDLVLYVRDKLVESERRTCFLNTWTKL